MSVLFFVLGCLQCALLWGLGKVGLGLAQRAQENRRVASETPPGGWPACALIVPVAGAHPDMERALRSLAEQDYPGYVFYLVTATRHEPANPLIARLMDEYPNVEHVLAGYADSGGQKNHNLLAGVEHAGDKAEIYAFCDSTHIAQPDFLRCLCAPIARNEAAFTTGYHEVEPRDQGIVSLAYAVCVMFMRFMQAIPALTQTWGGAMAMSRRAWHRADIAALWRDNVVDDCSLAAMLQGDGIPVRFCPAALLRTLAVNHPFAVWRAWLERQILFLKFCMPSQWLLLGAAALFIVLPEIWCVWACLRGMIGAGGGTAPFLALCWLLMLGWTLNIWRGLMPAIPPISRWLAAFFCACFMFALVFLGTIGTHAMLWHGIVYKVGKGGKILGIERR